MVLFWPALPPGRVGVLYWGRDVELALQAGALPRSAVFAWGFSTISLPGAVALRSRSYRKGTRTSPRGRSTPCPIRKLSPDIFRRDGDLRRDRPSSSPCPPLTRRRIEPEFLREYSIWSIPNF